MKLVIVTIRRRRLPCNSYIKLLVIFIISLASKYKTPNRIASKSIRSLDLRGNSRRTI